MTPKIYDCFCFFNENLLLEIRLATLWDYVDFFIIVESKFTISGKPKPINFDIKNYEQYASKIRYLLIDEYPFEMSDAWKNERYQRNFIMHGLQDATDSDWILVSDIDEIPRPEKILNFNPKKYIRADFEQRCYSYYLNNLNTLNGEIVKWYGSKITTFEHYKNFFCGAEQVRSYKSSGLLRSIKRWWFKKSKLQIIADGGWHFTWIGSIENIILKLESFAHQEFNKPEYKDPEVIKQKITSGYEIINPLGRCLPQDIDEQFPTYIIKNKHQLSSWLIEHQ